MVRRHRRRAATRTSARSSKAAGNTCANASSRWETAREFATGSPSASARRDRLASCGGISPEQLDGSTPCDDYDVRGLLNHIVSGNLWVEPLVAGKTIDEVGDRYDGDVLGDDASAAYDASARGSGRRVRATGRDGGAGRGVVRSGTGRGLRRSPIHRRVDPWLGSRRGDRPGQPARAGARRDVLADRPPADWNCCRGVARSAPRSTFRTTPTARRACSQCSAARRGNARRMR